MFHLHSFISTYLYTQLISISIISACMKSVLCVYLSRSLEWYSSTSTFIYLYISYICRRSQEWYIGSSILLYIFISSYLYTQRISASIISACMKSVLCKYPSVSEQISRVVCGEGELSPWRLSLWYHYTT